MSDPTTQPSLHVLCIEDDPGVARLIQKTLERVGHRVRLAPDGGSGIALASATAFDAIVLDHYMPDQDGLQVLLALRALPDPPPVIFATAAEEPRIAVTALKEGAADYVTKDARGQFLDGLDLVIRRALEQAQLRREKVAAEQELRESRDRLKTLASQQAVMLREVNHRVANSLQLINALIVLQSKRLADPGARDILSQAAKRVEAVSLVHRRLYTSGDVEFVEMDQYLAGLIAELRQAQAADSAECTIELRADPVRMETDKAVSIGLIVNELVTNALKYAYPGVERGAVRVRLNRDDTTAVSLVVEDDGVGLLQGSMSRGSGLGTIIVRSMVETLRATIELDPAHSGTRHVIRLDALPA